MAEQNQGDGWVFSNLQQFLQHALNCSNPSCILPLCVNTKLKLQHSRGCKELNCTICEEVKYLASKHSESCVDFNCRIPFCMGAKPDTHESAQFNLNKCNDDQSAVGSASIGGAIAATAKPKSSLESLSNNQDIETAPDLKLPTPTSTPLSRPVISLGSHPLMTYSTTINNQAPFHNTLSGTNSPYRGPDGNGLFAASNINIASDTASSPWYGSVEPLPTYQESTMTTNTQQERTTWPSLPTGRGTATEITRFTTDFSSPCPPTLQQNDAVSVQMSQNINKQTQQSTDQLLDTTCSQASRVQAYHSSTSAMGIISNGGTAKVNKAYNTRTLVKARLIDTLCRILQLIKRTRSTEQQLRYIRSLSIALGEVTKNS